MSHTPDTHAALYQQYTKQYQHAWPREALLDIGHSFALAYGMLPSATYFVQAWDLPSERVLLKIYPNLGSYRRDLLTTYPYLAEIEQWGCDVVRPWKTVQCLRCGKPMQTRNPAKRHLHTQCHVALDDEDGAWMNAVAVGEVREYSDLQDIGPYMVTRTRRHA